MSGRPTSAEIGVYRTPDRLVIMHEARGHADAIVCGITPAHRRFCPGYGVGWMPEITVWTEHDRFKGRYTGRVVQPFFVLDEEWRGDPAADFARVCDLTEAVALLLHGKQIEAHHHRALEDFKYRAYDGTRRLRLPG